MLDVPARARGAFRRPPCVVAPTAEIRANYHFVARKGGAIILSLTRRVGAMESDVEAMCMRLEPLPRNDRDRTCGG
jgi:hypothetical protein